MAVVVTVLVVPVCGSGSGDGNWVGGDKGGTGDGRWAGAEEVVVMVCKGRAGSQLPTSIINHGGG